MRVLLGCSLGGAGHLLPLTAAAAALERLGHTAIMVVPPTLRDRAAATGLRVTIGADPAPGVVDALWERVRGGPAESVSGLIDRELFAGHGAAAMLAPVRAALLAERPDLILREPSEYATAVVAHQAGLPHAQVGISLSAVEGSVLGDVADVLDGYGAGTVAAIRRAPYLTAFPSSLDPSPWRDTRRYRLPRLAVPPLPDWWDGDERPLILLSFGTVFGRLPEAVASYRTAIAALAGLPVRVLVTVGRDGLSLGPQPANVRVEPWVAQNRVLGVARLVVCHGGSGTTYGALAAGVPVVVCPFFADQGANAERVARSGAGRVYVPRSGEGQGIGGLTGADIAPLAAVVSAALADEHHRAAALRIASEVTGAPSLDDVLGQLLEEVPGMSGTEGPRPT